MSTVNERSQVIYGLLWKFGERITAQTISLVVSIILARLLSPTDFGSVALVMVFISLANVFVSNGLGSALIQKQNADNIDFSSVFYVNILLSFIIYIGIFILAPYIADFYGISSLRAVLRVLGIRVILAAINSVQQAYISRNMLFKKFFLSTLFGTLFSGIVGVWMAYSGYGIWALVFQYLTNSCVDTIILWFTVRWRPGFYCSWKRVCKLISFGWKILVSGLLDTGYNQIRSLLIGKVYTKEDLAFYNLGDKYPSLIITNVNASISSVFFPALSKVQDKESVLLSMTRRAIQVSSYIIWPMMIGLAVCADSIVSLLLTDKWLPCVSYLRIFCFTYGLWPIHTANLQALKAMGRSDLFLRLEIEKKIIGMSLLLISLCFGPFEIALSLAASGVISCFINAYPNTKLLHYKYHMQISDILHSFILSCLMGACIYPIKYTGICNILKIVIQICLGFFVYLFLSMLTKPEAFEYIVRLTNSYLKKRMN